MPLENMKSPKNQGKMQYNTNDHHLQMPNESQQPPIPSRSVHHTHTHTHIHTYTPSHHIYMTRDTRACVCVCACVHVHVCTATQMPPIFSHIPITISPSYTTTMLFRPTNPFLTNQPY